MPALIYSGTSVLTGADGSFTVTQTVNSEVPDTAGAYVWEFSVHNDSFEGYPSAEELEESARFTLRPGTVAGVGEEFTPGNWGFTAGLVGGFPVIEWEASGFDSDSRVLPGETVVFSFTTPVVALVDATAEYAETGPFAAAVGTLKGPAPLPVVTVAATGVSEGGTGTFVFTRTGSTSQSLTVNYTVGGTATSGTDFTALPLSVMFAANSPTAVVTLTAAHDTVYDPDETVVVTVTSGTGYTPGAASAATSTITEDAQMTFTLDNTSGTIWYTIPWDSVDTTLSTQSVAVSNFAISVAGQTFTEANANFTTLPVATFADGVFTGVTFAIDTSNVANYPYTSVSASGITLIAALPGGVPSLQSQVMAAVPSVTLWFNQTAEATSASLVNATTIRIQVKTAMGATYDYNDQPAAGQTVGDTVSIVMAQMRTQGWDVSPLASGRGFIIMGKRGANGVLDPVSQAGIFYQGSTVGQPVRPNLTSTTGLLYDATNGWYNPLSP